MFEKAMRTVKGFFSTVYHEHDAKIIKKVKPVLYNTKSIPVTTSLCSGDNEHNYFEREIILQELWLE